MSSRLSGSAVRRFRPSIETLEERLVPTFVWPANIAWPDTAAQGTQFDRTMLKRDYTQRAEAGTTSYTVTVSAGISWDSEWTVADGKQSITNKVGWFNAKLSKFQGENLVDFSTKSGSIASGTSGDLIQSLVVSVGSTGAGLDLFGFAVILRGV